MDAPQGTAKSARARRALRRGMPILFRKSAEHRRRQRRVDDAARRDGAEKGDEIGRAHVQPPRRRADGAHVARARRDGRAGRLDEDDAVAFQINFRFGRAEIDREADHDSTPSSASRARISSSGSPTTLV